ncbi:MAG: hypothetical protein K5672_03325 [Bacteroidaceae bacterium]|nr:hypothetical protein [Bacteroidaceae bacterium]
MRSVIVIALLLCTIPRPVVAQDEDAVRFGIKGFVDTYHALRTERPNDWMSSKTRVRGEFSVEKGHCGAFVSANLAYNAILKERSGFQLREAYAYYSNNHWDVRAGRQIITWGVADALRLTDIISPMDYTEFLAQDYDDIRIPVNGLRLRYSREKWSLEAVAIPVNSFYDLPTDGKNPWSIGSVSIGAEPAFKICNMEYGGRLSFFLSGIDFSFSALHTWNKQPVICNGVGEYRRMTMLGADMSVPIGKFVVRGEVAEYLDEAQSASVCQEVPRSASTNALLGIDWYVGNDWTLSAQYMHKYVAWGEHRNSGLATLRIAKDLLHNTLSLQTFAYIDVTNGGLFNRFSIDYALNDQLHAIVGHDLFHADAGMFSVYKKNSELFLKLKYSF